MRNKHVGLNRVCVLSTGYHCIIYCCILPVPGSSYRWGFVWQMCVCVCVYDVWCGFARQHDVVLILGKKR